MRSRYLFLAVLFSLTMAVSVCAEEGILTYAGATTLQTSFMPEAAQAFKQKTGVSVKILGGNTDAGLTALRQGMIDIAGAGRFLRPGEKAAGLKETLIGWDPMLVLVHRANPVSNLTLEQLSGIFSGNIGNWKEVGGEDAPILVVTLPRGAAMRDAVQSLLKLRAFTPEEITVPLTSDADRQLKVLPLAITVLSSSMTDEPEAKSIKVDGIAAAPKTVADQTYPLLKPLLLVTRRNPAEPTEQFVRFAVSEEGQRIMTRKFYPLR